MKLTRPLAIGILVLLAALILWLVAQSMGGDRAPTGGSGGGQPTQGAHPSQDETDRPSGDDDERPSGGQNEPNGPYGVDTRDWDDIDACRDTDLPDELDPLVGDIEAGGPYEYSGKDGSTFVNREGELPQESGGYYREFTVTTPGSSDRGARRVVTGGPEETSPDVWYYTDDHYATFCEFAPDHSR